MNNPTLKESDYFIAWIIFFAIALVGGAVAGFVAGGIVGLVLGAGGASVRTIQAFAAVAGFIVGLPISYGCFRLVVGKFIVQKLRNMTAISTESAYAPPPVQS